MGRGVISFASAKLIREAKPLLSRSVKAKKRHLGESGGIDGPTIVVSFLMASIEKMIPHRE